MTAMTGSASGNSAKNANFSLQLLEIRGCKKPLRIKSKKMTRINFNRYGSFLFVFFTTYLLNKSVLSYSESSDVTAVAVASEGNISAVIGITFRRCGCEVGLVSVSLSTCYTLA